MKTNLLLLILIFAGATKAQIVFERPFGDAHRTLLNNIVENPQGGYLVCGSDCNSFPCIGYIAALDATGNLLWENNLFIPDSDFIISHMITLDSNAFVLQCSADKSGSFYPVPRLLKMDSSGLINDTFFVDISGVYNGTYNAGLFHGANKTIWCVTYIDGTGPDNIFTIVRHNANLDTLINLTDGGNENHYFTSNHSGQFGARAEPEIYDSTLGGFTKLDALWRTDTAGAVNFVSLYDSLPLSQDFLLRDDGGFITFRGNHVFSDTLFINHFDTSGQLQFQKLLPLRWDAANGYFRAYASLAADSGYFLILTQHDTVQYNLVNAQLCKFNNQDDTLWTLNVARNYLDRINQITPTSDGGCVLLFHTTGFGDSLNYLVKIGPNGENTLSVEEQIVNELVLYPNPTTGIFTIQGISSNEKSVLQVINLFGDVIYTKTILGMNEYKVDAHLPKGIYFVRLSNEKGNLAKVLVVE